VLLLPGAVLFGGGLQPLLEGEGEDPVERAMQAGLGRAAERFRLPEPTMPPPGGAAGDRGTGLPDADRRAAGAGPLRQLSSGRAPEADRQPLRGSGLPV